MKKLLLLLIVIAGAFRLKAQQTTIKPFDQNIFKDQNSLQFKPGDSILFKNFSATPNGQLLAIAPNGLADNNMLLLNPAVNIDHMLIAKPSGNMEKMPVAKVMPLGLLKPVTP